MCDAVKINQIAICTQMKGLIFVWTPDDSNGDRQTRFSNKSLDRARTLEQILKILFSIKRQKTGIGKN